MALTTKIKVAMAGATLALVYSPLESLELRLDNEYRLQEESLLRSSADEAYLASKKIVIVLSDL